VRDRICYEGNIKVRESVRYYLGPLLTLISRFGYADIFGSASIP